MKLLKGTITKLERELEIKGRKIETLKAKRDDLQKQIDAAVDEVSELSQLIAQGKGNGTDV